ncbi:MAG: TolC family protein [Proteobacteria bacterium]|nr:TolC family protein [Pseudomonadota bacterium]
MGFRRRFFFRAIIALAVGFAGPAWTEVRTATDSQVAAIPLRYLLDAALKTHPLVAAGRAQLRGANQGLKSARWQFFPTPGASYQRAFADDFDRNFQGDKDTTVLFVEQPLWTGGRLRGGMALARADVKVSEAALEESQRELALRVVQAYGEWLAAWLQNRTLSTSASRHQGLFERVDRRLAGGVSTGSDLELASGRLHLVKADKAAAVAREISAVAVLIELTGESLASHLMAPARNEFPPELPASELALIEQALRASPSIKRADAEVLSARAEIKTRRAQIHPDVFLRFERQINDLQFAGQDPNSRVLVGVRSQLGAGLSSFSGVAQARESFAAALAFRRSAELTLREQIRADLALLDSFELRMPALQEAARTATQVYESYQRQFLTGRKSWLDVMNSARDLQQAQLQLADITAEQLTLSWRLHVLSNPMTASLGGLG